MPLGVSHLNLIFFAEDAVADAVEPFQVKRQVVVFEEDGFDAVLVNDVFYVVDDVVNGVCSEAFAHVQVDGAENAVERAAPAGYHGD